MTESFSDETQERVAAAIRDADSGPTTRPGWTAMKPAPRTEPPTTTKPRPTSKRAARPSLPASRSLFTHSRNRYLDRPVGPLPAAGDGLRGGLRSTPHRARLR